MEVAKDSRIVFLQQKTIVPDSAAPRNTKAVAAVPIAEIQSSPFQTRQFDDSTDLSELAASIGNHGVLQPVLLRNREPGKFELVAGERRLRAARLAGLTEIPALVSELSDRETVEISIIENAQRENLNPIEEARALSILLRNFSLSQADIAQRIGKSRAAVANSLRLLQLDSEVQDLIVSGQLSAGHGKALLTVGNHLLQRRLARRAARRGMSVRLLEELASRLQEKSQTPKRKLAGNRVEAKEESKLQALLGIERVSVRSGNDGGRSVVLRFEDEKKWKQFLSRLKRR